MYKNRYIFRNTQVMLQRPVNQVVTRIIAFLLILFKAYPAVPILPGRSV